MTTAERDMLCSLIGKTDHLCGTAVIFTPFIHLQLYTEIPISFPVEDRLRLVVIIADAQTFKFSSVTHLTVWLIIVIHRIFLAKYITTTNAGHIPTFEATFAERELIASVVVASP